MTKKILLVGAIAWTAIAAFAHGGSMAALVISQVWLVGSLLSRQEDK